MRLRTAMLYRTMMLDLLQANPRLYEQLRATGVVRAPLERYARQLRADHDQLTARMRSEDPDLDPHSAASAALEVTLAAWADSLARAALPPK